MQLLKTIIEKFQGQDEIHDTCQAIAYRPEKGHVEQVGTAQFIWVVDKKETVPTTTIASSSQH
jgi:hypothetical protein